MFKNDRKNDRFSFRFYFFLKTMVFKRKAVVFENDRVLKAIICFKIDRFKKYYYN